MICRSPVNGRSCLARRQARVCRFCFERRQLKASLPRDGYEAMVTADGEVAVLKFRVIGVTRTGRLLAEDCDGARWSVLPRSVAYSEAAAIAAIVERNDELIEKARRRLHSLEYQSAVARVALMELKDEKSH